PDLLYATIDSHSSDISASADWHIGSSQVWCGVLTRYSDDENYVLARYHDGEVALYQRQNGTTSSALGSQQVPVVAGTHKLRVQTSGTHARVSWDDALQFEATLPSTLSGTRVGLTWSNCYDT